MEGLEKLEEAEWAGSERSPQCTLIITEGDSAKALAVAGLEIVGRERFGVFPVRGKFLNTRDLGEKKVGGVCTKDESGDGEC